MGFKDDILSSMKTPREAEQSNNDLFTNQCKASVEATVDRIKYYLKEAASKGEYEQIGGMKYLSVKAQLVNNVLLTHYSCSANGKPDRYIENNLFHSFVDIKYDSKWKHNIFGQIKETIYTYDVYIKDEYKYNTFVKQLRDMLSEDGIEFSIKMTFSQHSDEVSQFVNFPGTVTGRRGGTDDEYDNPKEWVRIFVCAEMRL